MPTTFSRSLRSLETVQLGPSLIAILISMLLLALWCCWFLLGKVPVYEVTDDARIEVSAAAHTVGCPSTGRVMSVSMMVGELVEAGHPLVLLTSDRESSRVTTELLHFHGVQEQLLTQIHRRESARKAAGAEFLSDASAIEGAKADLRQIQVALRKAEDDIKRATKLRSEGLLSDSNMGKMEADVEKLSASSDALRFAIERLGSEMVKNENKRAAEISEIDRQIAAMKSEMAESESTSARLHGDVEERTIRAPIAGYLGQVMPLQPGSMVFEGDTVAVIVPEGDFKIVSRFPAATSLGRLKPGQVAQLRLSAFPWTRFGVIEAVVTRVGIDTTQGSIPVELRIPPNGEQVIVMQHGLHGTLSVEVEHASPAELILAMAGNRLGRR